MTDKHSVTCPQATRTEVHRKRLRKWWASKEWKEYVRVHTSGKVCEECGAKSGEVVNNRKPAVLTINHLYRNLYNSFEEYLKFAPDKTTITCTTCNWMYEKGMNCCPRCKKYKKWYQPLCSTCFKQEHPDIEENRKRKEEEIKAVKKRLREDEKKRVKEWKLQHRYSGR